MGETPPVAGAIRNTIVQHWKLAAITLIVWVCFAIGFVSSGIFGD